VIGVCKSNTPEQVLPQSIPAGEEATLPEPVPDLTTVSAGWVAVKLAVQLTFASITNEVVAEVPVHAPDQPRKPDPAGTIAIRLTTVPAAKLAAQVPPQEIPAGEELMLPVPSPELATANVRDAAGGSDAEMASGRGGKSEEAGATSGAVGSTTEEPPPQLKNDAHKATEDARRKIDVFKWPP
jgi:hypothetical protein